MVDLNPTISKLILSVDALSTPVKRHCHIRFLKRPNYILSVRYVL